MSIIKASSLVGQTDKSWSYRLNYFTWNLVTTLVFLSFPPILWAGHWEITPRLTVRETYVDNLFLTPDCDVILTPNCEVSDFVTEINPGISITGESARLSFSLDYTLQNLFYTDSEFVLEDGSKVSDSHALNHDLYTTATGELIEQAFFVDALASVSQQSTDFRSRSQFLRGLRDNVYIVNDPETGERARFDYTSYMISPYFLHHFGNVAEAELRFAYSKGSSDAGEVEERESSDSQSQKYYAGIESGPRFSVFPWRLFYDRDEIEQGTSDIKLENILGEIEYVYDREFGLLGALGYENNDFLSRFGSSEGVIWDVGFRWTPSTRTSLRATYGQRFFGDRYFVDFAHRSRRTIFLARYTQEPYTTSELRLGEAAARGADIPIDPIIGSPILDTGGLATLSDEVFVRELFSAGLVFTGRRNSVYFRGVDEQRDYQFSGDQQDILGIEAQWTRRMSRITDLHLGAGWITLDDSPKPPTDREHREDDFVYVDFGIEHRFGRHLTGEVSYRRIEQLSIEEEDEFVDNRVMLGITMYY